MKAVTEHQEVTLDIIQQLKTRGFTHIQFELKDSGNPIQALVEVIPGKGEGSVLDNVSLDSREILDYFGEVSVMTRYVIGGVCLKLESEP